MIITAQVGSLAVAIFVTGQVRLDHGKWFFLATVEKTDLSNVLQAQSIIATLPGSQTCQLFRPNPEKGHEVVPFIPEQEYAIWVDGEKEHFWAVEHSQELNEAMQRYKDTIQAAERSSGQIG